MIRRNENDINKSLNVNPKYSFKRHVFHISVHQNLKPRIISCVAMGDGNTPAQTLSGQCTLA